MPLNDALVEADWLCDFETLCWADKLKELETLCDFTTLNDALVEADWLCDFETLCCADKLKELETLFEATVLNERLVDADCLTDSLRLWEIDSCLDWLALCDTDWLWSLSDNFTVTTFVVLSL